MLLLVESEALALPALGSLMLLAILESEALHCFAQQH